MRIPLNRIVAFVGPYISIVAAGAAAWLVAKLNLLGVPGLDEANTATWISGALTFIVTAGLTWLGQSKWLKGHHIELAAEAQVQAAAVAASAAPVAGPPELGPGLPGEEEVLPSDDEEFSSPPPTELESARTPDNPDA